MQQVARMVDDDRGAHGRFLIFTLKDGMSFTLDITRCNEQELLAERIREALS